ncbi:stalk domain-containing protein [Paenibacillus sp. CF384]|uniref:stalk domain-containing protein n=1 Tax=Paenibacillus sp. CF384 TaxID=1884382 RepID=UPI0008953CDE|nr:stalk domain-containing protein [Paenibacillus sp. CF384]SDX03777.1 Alpha-tubulin suppressor [Paenibacillus sp. CF384]
MTFGGKVITNVKQVASGYGSTLALKKDGTVWSWGANLGSRLTTTAVQVPGLSDVESISFSSTYSDTAAFVKKDGTVWMLGSLRYGTFDGVTYSSTNPLFTRVPKQMDGLQDVKAIELGYHAAFALKKDGTVWSWGSNEYGELGNGKVKSLAAPALVAGLPPITAIHSDGITAYVIDNKGELWYWGSPYWYYYQTGKQAVITKPRRFEKLDHIKAITSSGSSTLLLRTDGTVWSFGDNYGGVLGRNKDPLEGPLHLVQIPELQSIDKLSCGYLQCLALDQLDQVWVWGNNSYRQIGDGLQPHRFDHPVKLAHQQAVEVVSGSRSSFLIKKDGTLWGAGLNRYGQIGRGVLGQGGGEDGFGVPPYSYEPYSWGTLSVTKYEPVLEAPCVLVNGKQIVMWSMQIDGSVYASVRGIMEAMGYRLTWNDQDKIAVALKDGKEFSFHTEETGGIYVNGKSTAIGKEVYSVRGELLAPVRELGAAFGWTTSWEPESNTIRVSE